MRKYPPFDLKGNDPVPESEPEMTAEQTAHLEILLSRRISIEEMQRLELLLLQRMKERREELTEMLALMSSHWKYEDHFYRFYHGSWKVYGTQSTTAKAVGLLRGLLPERELNLLFETIQKDGSGDDIDDERRILEAFSHAKFMIEMAVRYSELETPPKTLPSGWAALLYLYYLR